MIKCRLRSAFKSLSVRMSESNTFHRLLCQHSTCIFQVTSKSKEVSSHVNYSQLTQDSFEGNFGDTQHVNVMVQGSVVLLVLWPVLGKVGHQRWPSLTCKPSAAILLLRPLHSLFTRDMTEETDWPKHMDTRLTLQGDAEGKTQRQDRDMKGTKKQPRPPKLDVLINSPQDT